MKLQLSAYGFDVKRFNDLTARNAPPAEEQSVDEMVNYTLARCGITVTNKEVEKSECI